MVKAEIDGAIVLERPILVPSRQKKLDALEEYLRENGEFTNDPIEFIEAHYHGDTKKGIEEKSLRQLWEFLKDKGVDYASEDGLHKFMRDLGFAFKDHRTQTETGKLSLTTGAQNTQRLEANVAIFRKALVEIVGKNTPENNSLSSFNIKEYEAIKFPIDKVLYLLKIDKKSFGQIYAITGLGAQALMTAINTILSEIVQKIKTQLNHDIEVPKISKGSLNNLISKLQ